MESKKITTKGEVLKIEQHKGRVDHRTKLNINILFILCSEIYILSIVHNKSYKMESLNIYFDIVFFLQ